MSLYLIFSFCLVRAIAISLSPHRQLFLSIVDFLFTVEINMPLLSTTSFTIDILYLLSRFSLQLFYLYYCLWQTYLYMLSTLSHIYMKYVFTLSTIFWYFLLLGCIYIVVGVMPLEINKLIHSVQ